METYKAKNGLGDCEQCPEHSSTRSTGSPECQCDAGYYRANDEGPEFSCTRKFFFSNSTLYCLIITKNFTI